MRYIQFFHNSTGYIAGTTPPQFSPEHVKPIPDCGSDSVLRLDGRFNMSTCVQVAREACRARRGCVGFTINAGRSYSDSREIRKFEQVTA